MSTRLMWIEKQNKIRTFNAIQVKYSINFSMLRIVFKIEINFDFMNINFRRLLLLKNIFEVFIEVQQLKT